MLAPLLIALPCAGCFGKPNPANVKLRRENQELLEKVATLQAQNDQLKSDVRRLESDQEVLPTLPQERLDQLWTVAGVKFGRLTGIDRRSEGQPLKVYLKPTDAEGSTMKAAGSIVIEAFDLNAPEARLARWEFPLDEAKRNWTSVGMINEYVLSCPWVGEAPIEGRKLLIKATFTDALTQRTFEARTDVQ